MEKEFGTIEKVELRKLWKDEPRDFTPWLADNIDILSEILNMNLEVLEEEKNIGSYNADILCEDTEENRTVIIENQLEKTDHNHLGQLLTYAAGVDAFMVIWISKKFNDEHRAALDWLNENTDDGINLFGIEIELIKIEDSNPAPNFKIVSEPNNWTKTIRKSVKSSKLTETKLLQKEYWESLKNLLENTNSVIKPRKPRPQHWTNFAIGSSKFHLSATANTRDNKITVELNIDTSISNERFNKLKQDYEESAKEEINQDLIWRKLPDKKSSYIVLEKHVDIYDKDNWDEQQRWLKENLEKFYNFFKPKIKNL